MHWTYYKRPKGRQIELQLKLGPDAEKKAAELFAAGWRFTSERLQHTDEVSVECCNDSGPLAIKIYAPGDHSSVEYGRMVLTGIVEAAHRAWVKRNRISAAEWDAEKDDVQDD
jgi:hypothetical protein